MKSKYLKITTRNKALLESVLVHHLQKKHQLITINLNKYKLNGSYYR